MKLFIALIAALLAGCTQPETATRALEGAGYVSIVLTGPRFYGCADDDNFATGFEAIGPTGKQVTGVVCSGFLKGSTIRID